MASSIDSVAQAAANAERVPIEVWVRTVRQEALGIRSYELVEPSGVELPPFTAGAHVEVMTPIGEWRQYSLCGTPGERHRYLIAVKREAQGRGGSASLYDAVREGARLLIRPPANFFPLADDARRHVLIAGGIGITPILAMVQELSARGADFTLYYCSRAPEHTAFAERLAEPAFAGRVVLHHDDGDPAKALPLGPILDVPDDGTHVYCCGPRSLLKAVQAAAAQWPSGTVHFEDFGATAEADGSGNRSFTVKIASTGEEIMVDADKSILETLLEHGYDVPSSCQSGTCGTCMTGLIDGEADHRDFVLSEEDGQRFIMICVSRAKGGRLTLAL